MSGAYQRISGSLSAHALVFQWGLHRIPNPLSRFLAYLGWSTSCVFSLLKIPSKQNLPCCLDGRDIGYETRYFRRKPRKRKGKVNEAAHSRGILWKKLMSSLTSSASAMNGGNRSLKQKFRLASLKVYIYGSVLCFAEPPAWFRFV